MIKDIVYDGIHFDGSGENATVLHAVNKMFLMFQYAIKILNAVEPKEIKKILEHNKMQSTMLEDISSNVQMAFAAIHYGLVKPYAKEFNTTTKEYLMGLDTISKEIYRGQIMAIPFSNAVGVRINSAYSKIERSLEKFDKDIAEGGVFGQLSKSKKLIDHHRNLLEETLKAKDYVNKVMKQLAKAEKDKSNPKIVPLANVGDNPK
jgi:hypothetical protein